MRKALNERERSVGAAFALAGLASDGAELIPDLLKALRRESLELMQAAEKAVPAVGVTAIPHLVKALKDRALSSTAADLLRSLRAVARPALADLLALADNRSELPSTRSSAINALSAVGADAAPAVGRLIAIACGEKESSVRVNALRAVHAIGVQNAADQDALTRLVDDPDASVAAAARDILKR